MITHSGFIALIGRPNVGKSTLLNAILDRKIAIVSPKPQTTRMNIRGILHRGGSELILVDTPGVNRARRSLDRHLARNARSAAKAVDGLWHVVDVSRPPREEDHWGADLCRAAGAPIWLLANKSDLVATPEERMTAYRMLADYERGYAVSALTGTGIDRLLADALACLPEGMAYFPEDMVTDQPEDTYVAEAVREQILLATEDEVPHSVAVVVEERTLRPNHTMYLRATVYVERESQKAILIGAGGRMLRRIGETSRRGLEEYFQTRVYLDLWVKVRRHWRDQEDWLRRLGFTHRE